MKSRPIDDLVFEAMFPVPRQVDPHNFFQLLGRYLIPEVRQEVQAFYGHVNTPEARYPGLDYNHRIHRIRLSRWPCHRRLFSAFDALGLTPFEIDTLAKWEGTKWAKQQFEKDQGYTIRDTTFDEIAGSSPTWSPSDMPLQSRPISPQPMPPQPMPPQLTSPQPMSPRSVSPQRIPSIHISRTAIRPSHRAPRLRPPTQDIIGTVDEELDAEESEEEEMESVGIALNAHLQEAVAQRAAGDPTAVLDEEWEQWLKSVIETGNLSSLPQPFSTPSEDRSPVPLPLHVPTHTMNLARAGRWNEVPEFLHVLITRIFEYEAMNNPDTGDDDDDAPAGQGSSPRGADAALNATLRRTHAGLRLPTVSLSVSSQ